jgi:hypothetical protein
MAHGILHVHSKVGSVFWPRKIRFAISKSADILLAKYSWLNMLPLGRTLNMISFFAVKSTVIIVLFAPTACRILGRTSAAERVNIFKDAVVC